VPLLDRYIIRQYFVNILVLFTLLFAVIIVTDFSLNFDEYVKVANRLHKINGTESTFFSTAATATYLVWDLWWPRLFLLYNFLLALVLIGAMGFTCAQLNRHREFVAILAGGLSLHRVARPIVIAAVALTCFAAVNREVIIPRLAPLLTREKGEAGTRSLGSMALRLTPDSRGRLFYANAVSLDSDTISGLYVWERDSDGLMTRRITAAQATWDPRGGWALTDATAESRQPSNSGEAAPTRAITPETFLDTDLDPTALKLRRFESYSNYLSTAELSMLVNNHRSQPRPNTSLIDRLERIRYGRVAGYACTVLLLLTCLPFYIRREPGNLLVQTLLSAPVAIVGFVMTMVGTSAAIPGLPPQLSVFLPVMVLMPLAIAAVTSIRT
jgi:lipopolysaccharide export LptBFGC system permease protein LptF